MARRNRSKSNKSSSQWRLYLFRGLICTIGIFTIAGTVIHILNSFPQTIPTVNNDRLKSQESLRFFVKIK
jgi:hypothetical protein